MGLELYKRDNSKYFWAGGTLKIDGKKKYHRLSLKTADKDEARALCLQLEIDLLLGKVAVKKKTSNDYLTMSDLVKRYAADPSTGSSRTTHQILNRLDNYWGDADAIKLTKGDVSQFLFEEHISKGHGDCHIRRTATQIQAVLNYGYDQGWRKDRITIKKPSPPAGRIVTLSDEELKGIHKHMPASCRRLASFMLNTGARPDEAYKLTKKDVDWQRKKVRLTSIKGRDRKPRTRVVPLNPKAFAAVHGSKGSSPDKDSDYVFSYDTDKVNRHQEAIQKTFAGGTYFYSKWSRACKKAGVEGKSPYALRHSFGSRLGNNNTPFAVITLLMGHTNPLTTMLYVHPEFEDHLTAVSNL